MPIEMVVDNNGRVVRPSIHDAIYSNLEIRDTDSDNGRSLHLGAIKDSSNYLVKLSGISLLNAQTWEGGIIADIYTWKVTSVPETVWILVDGIWNVLLSGRVRPADRRNFVADLVNKNPHAIAVYIEFSYGGVIAAVCNELEITLRSEEVRPK